MRRDPAQGQVARYEIVGIVRDVRDAPLGQAVEPAVYFSTQQFPFRELFVAVRAADRAAALAAGRAAPRGGPPNGPHSSAPPPGGGVPGPGPAPPGVLPA